MAELLGHSIALDLDVRSGLTIASGRVTQWIDQADGREFFQVVNSVRPFAPARDAQGLYGLRFETAGLDGPALGISGDVNSFVILNQLAVGTELFPHIFEFGVAELEASTRVLTLYIDAAESEYVNSYNGLDGPRLPVVLNTPQVLAWGFNDGQKYLKMLPFGGSLATTVEDDVDAISEAPNRTSRIGGQAGGLTTTIARMIAIDQAMASAQVDAVMRELVRQHAPYRVGAQGDFEL